MFSGVSRFVGRVSVVAAVLICAGAEAANDRDPPGSIPYDLAFSLREFRRFDEVTVSPDGERVAYVVVTPPQEHLQNEPFLPNGTPDGAVGARIHLMETSAQQGADRQVCAGRGNQWAPAWSPNSRLLGFYSDADGLPQFWTYDLKSGECRRASTAAIRVSDFSGFEARWAPDGRTVYVPLNPNPPASTVSAASTTERREARTGEPESGAVAPPSIFLSGSEDERTADPGKSKSGNERERMLHLHNSTLSAIDAESGAMRVVVEAQSEPRPNILKISASGRWMSYRSVFYREQEITTESVMDLAVVPVAGGTPTVIAKALQYSHNHFVNYSRLNYRWHPREDRLVYLKDNALWLVEFAKNAPKAPRRLASRLGELAPVVLYFTKDGRSLVVGADPAGDVRDRVPRRLAMVPLDGGEPVSFALPDPNRWRFHDVVRANEDVLWQPDARYFTVMLRDRSTGEQGTFRLDTATGKSTPIAQGLYQFSRFRSGGDHRHLVGMYEDVATPPDLYRFPADFSGKTRLSVIEPRLESVRFGTAEVLETRVPLFDGRIESVRTTVLLPPGAKRGDRLPAIVMIYSGSDLSGSATYFGGGNGNTVPNLVFTSRGFAVIMANVILAPEGEPSHPLQHMVDVLLPQVYHAVDAGYVDVNRLAVSGQSYGGYSTAAIVSQTNLFRAGIPVNGLFDLASDYGHFDDRDGNNGWLIAWAEKGQGRMGHSPWINPQRYSDNSPYYRLERIRTPLLIVAGEKDSTSPHEESKKLFAGLRRLERPAQLAIYPGEGHVINEWTTAHAADVSRRMVEFLRKHLGEVRDVP